jgi:hypothetical protein
VACGNDNDVEIEIGGFDLLLTLTAIFCTIVPVDFALSAVGWLLGYSLQKNTVVFTPTQP